MLGGKVYVTLIICVAFLMSGGASQVGAEDNLTVKGFLERSTGETLELSKVELIKVIEPEFIKVIEPEFVEATDPDFLVPFVDSDGLTKRGGQQKSVEQIMCGPSNGLPTPEECLFEGQ